MEYSLSDLMAAVIDLRDATARGFERVDRRIDQLKDDMNRRFDSVDLRFDAFEKRVTVLEKGS